jgi:RNA polymerase sigma-70 factor (ECF subfamily)
MNASEPVILANKPVDQTDSFSLATRASLLSRLKDLDNQASWQEFFDTYSPLTYGLALKAGLSQAEAQDVVQEVVVSAAKHLPSFHYDPKVCSFKTWLLRLTRWRIIDQLSKRLPSQQLPEARFDDDSTATALLDRLAGGVAPDLEKLWSAEWEKIVLVEALERVKQHVRPEQYQIFDLYALKGVPVSEVAKLLAVSVAQVYLTKHRVGKLVRKEILNLEQESQLKENR